MDGRCFSLRPTRDVILGRDVPSNRTHPYIALYQGKEDFEGRIEVVKRVVRPEPEATAEVVPEIVVEQVAESPDKARDIQSPAPEIRGWVRLIRRAA